jgi:hypothetical protein
MKLRSLGMQFLVAVLAAGLFAACGLAQAPPAHRALPPGAPAGFAQQPALPPPPPPEGFDMLGFEPMRGGKVVKGSPFSAVAVSETTQVLADGNHIHRQTSTALFRDTQGRFRREVTLPAIGPLAASGDAPQFVIIHDPVAGQRFVLDLKNKTANKMTATPRMQEGPRERARAWKHFERTGESDMIKTESLGTQVIEGVSAEGTRTTRTIPIGRIGNEKPITIVSEVWYSPDLQLVVMTRRSDPRFGETIYKLTNVQRAEPSASLFQVPADFTVQEGRHGMRMFHFQRAPEPPKPNGEL